MNLKNKILTGIIIATPFTLGIFADRIFKDFPYLQLDPKIDILSLASLIVTIILAFLIPFLVSKIIEDQRGVKAFQVDELKELLCIIEKVKMIISEAHTNGAFEPKDRDQINYIFHEAELKTYSIIEQVKISFPAKSERIQKTLTDNLFAYKDYVTGGELMLSSFVKVDEHFYRENKTEYTKAETILKILIQQIYKF